MRYQDLIFWVIPSFIALNINLTSDLLKQNHLFFVFVSHHSCLLLTSGLDAELKGGFSLLLKKLFMMGILLQKGDSCFSLFSLTSSSSRDFLSSISTSFYCSAIGVPRSLVLSITFLTNSSSPSGFIVS